MDDFHVARNIEKVRLARSVLIYLIRKIFHLIIVIIQYYRMKMLFYFLFSNLFQFLAIIHGTFLVHNYKFFIDPCSFFSNL